MTVMLSCNNVRMDYPTKSVFSDLSLGVNTGDRIGIVGSNGDGKSTLLNILSRRVAPTDGDVVYNGTSTVGVLSQSDDFNDDDTVDSQLGASGQAYTWKADRNARTIVNTLLRDVSLDATIGTLSGGQRRRLDLARLLIGDWDILMLDEPTNHLDIGAINWLAQHLKTRWHEGEGALLVVTHDRWFLDEVCQSMWEVHDGEVEPFEGGYSAYIMQRVERERLRQQALTKRKNELRKELAWLSRGAQARRSKPKFHVEAAQKLIADEPPVRNSIELKQMATARLGKQVVDLQDVCMTRGGKTLFEDVTWSIGPGDRIGILGENGVGKSTLLQIIQGKLKPTWGHVKIGKTVKFGALTQNLDELKDIQDDVVREVCKRYNSYYVVDGKKTSPVQLLQRLGFSSDQLNARVKDLSGGQRRRMQFLFTLFDEPNVLILDEPGNDMDTDMLSVMEDLLDSWPGTLILVSHDRYMLERVCDMEYAIIGTHVRSCPGGVDEYLRLLEEETAHPVPKQPAKQSTTPTAERNKELKANGKLTSGEAYELRKKVASAQRKVNTQEKRVAKAQQALADADPFDFAKLEELQKNIDAEKARQEKLEDEWLELEEKLEEGTE